MGTHLFGSPCIIGIEAHEMSPHTVFNVKMFTFLQAIPFGYCQKNTNVIT